MKRFLASLLFLGGALARPLFMDDEYSFEQYLKDFDKKYESEVELGQRRAIFEKRVHEIKKHNTLTKSTFQKGVNHLTDWTEDELNSLMGYKRGISEPGKPSIPFDLAMGTPTGQDDRAVQRKLSSLPKSVNCCWSFAGTEAIESDLYINTGKLVKLSQQEFVSCMPNPEQCGGKGGCQGATCELLFQYAVDKGLVLEEEYPYSSGTGDEPMCTLPVKQPVAGMLGYVRVPTNDYNALMQAIQLKPIAISVDASGWHNYHSGVLDYNNCGSTINHAVVLAGYGTDPEFGEYWLVRNSWGPGWGEGGYIRLSRDTGCSVDTNPLDGSGCKGGPSNVTVCGTCGILYDNSFPVGSYFL